MPDEELSVSQCLEYLKDHYNDTVSRQTLYAWMTRGRKLPSGHMQFLRFRQSRCRRLIKRSELDRFWREEL